MIERQEYKNAILIIVKSHDQLKLILDVIGTPSMTDFIEVTSRRSREYLRNLPMRPKKSFESLYPRASGQAIDFLKKTLTCKPSIASHRLSIYD